MAGSVYEWWRKVFILLWTGSRKKEIPKARYSPAGQILVAQFFHLSPTPNDVSEMHPRCMFFPVGLRACFFVSLLSCQHQCEGKRSEEKRKSQAKASGAVDYLPWDALVKSWVTVIPSESYTGKPEERDEHLLGTRHVPGSVHSVLLFICLSVLGWGFFFSVCKWRNWGSENKPLTGDSQPPIRTVVWTSHPVYLQSYTVQNSSHIDTLSIWKVMDCHEDFL